MKTMDTTRRGFIGTLAGAIAVPAIGSANRKVEEFQDIRVDRYYVLKGGQYKDTGGVGAPGVSEGSALKEVMDWHIYCRDLDDWIAHNEKNGYYFEAYGYFGADDGKLIGKVELKRDWLLKFYDLHKNETKQDWEDRYAEYLKSIGYPPPSARTSRTIRKPIGGCATGTGSTT